MTAKNVCSVLGKPLIEYTFETASYFRGVCPVYVSTDDERVSEIAEQFNFNVVKRPLELADDKAKMSDVLEHFVKQLNTTDDVCVLYPTNPLRTHTHVIEALKVWRDKKGEVSQDLMGLPLIIPETTLMSVSPVKYRPFGLMEKQENGFLKCSHSYGELFYQDQSTPPLYRANGAVYIIPAQVILEHRINSQLFNKVTIPYVMDDISGFEIDVPADVPVAEALMRFRGVETRVTAYA